MLVPTASCTEDMETVRPRGMFFLCGILSAIAVCTFLSYLSGKMLHNNDVASERIINRGSYIRTHVLRVEENR